MKHPTFWRATIFGLIAGSIAILINIVLLSAADLIPLVTAKGGLLKLLTPYISPLLAKLGVTHLWSSMHLPGAQTTTFKTVFHIMVGLGMALFYVYLLKTRLPGPPWLKGTIYAAAIWLANAFLVLPSIGEGIAGSRSLGLPGMVYFAVAHTVFFVLLAVLYDRLVRQGEKR